MVENEEVGPDVDLDAAVAVSLAAGGVQFEADDAALLRAIADTGSVSAAAETLGRSRSRALGRLETLESAVGELVVRRRGGPDGGGSRLTTRGERLLARFARLRTAVAGTAGTTESVFDGTVMATSGELVTVDTAAGRIRALTGGDLAVGETAQVSVRADTVTLHDPDDAPSDTATSARNRFTGRVTHVDPGVAVTRVRLILEDQTPLVALVTADSADQLALEAGRSVVASFKATATRVITSW